MFRSLICTHTHTNQKKNEEEKFTLCLLPFSFATHKTQEFVKHIDKLDLISHRCCAFVGASKSIPQGKIGNVIVTTVEIHTRTVLFEVSLPAQNADKVLQFF